MAKKYKVSDTKLTTRMLLTYNSWHYSYECENCKQRLDFNCDSDIEEFKFCNCCGCKVIEIVNILKN